MGRMGRVKSHFSRTQLKKSDEKKDTLLENWKEFGLGVLGSERKMKRQ